MAAGTSELGSQTVITIWRSKQDRSRVFGFKARVTSLLGIYISQSIQETMSLPWVLSSNVSVPFLVCFRWVDPCVPGDVSNIQEILVLSCSLREPCVKGATRELGVCILCCRIIYILLFCQKPASTGCSSSPPRNRFSFLLFAQCFSRIFRHKKWLAYP